VAVSQDGGSSDATAPVVMQTPGHTDRSAHPELSKNMPPPRLDESHRITREHGHLALRRQTRDCQDPASPNRTNCWRQKMLSGFPAVVSGHRASPKPKVTDEMKTTTPHHDPAMATTIKSHRRNTQPWPPRTRLPRYTILKTTRRPPHAMGPPPARTGLMNQDMLSFITLARAARHNDEI